MLTNFISTAFYFYENIKYVRVIPPYFYACRHHHASEARPASTHMCESFRLLCCSQTNGALILVICLFSSSCRYEPLRVAARCLLCSRVSAALSWHTERWESVKRLCCGDHWHWWTHTPPGRADPSKTRGDMWRRGTAAGRASCTGPPPSMCRSRAPGVAIMAPRCMSSPSITGASCWSHAIWQSHVNNDLSKPVKTSVEYYSIISVMFALMRH